jgi:membrane protein implicated in regulation of membrane protease activity
MKKGPGFILSFVFSIAFVSAQGFGNFGFLNLFSSFNVSMYLTALLFATIFAVIYFIIGKTPLGDNTAVRWIIALCAASFSIWGIISTGFSFENFLFRFGITGDILPTVLWMAGVIIALILIAKFGFRNFFAIAFGLGGAVILALSIFGALHEQGAGLIIGVGFLIIALILKRGMKNRRDFKKLSIDKQMDYKQKKVAYKEWKRQRKKEQLQRWNRAGRNIGYYGAKTAYAPIKAGKKVKGWFK